MMRYFELSVVSRACFAVCVLILIVGAVFLFTGVCLARSGRKCIICSAVILGVMLFIFQGIIDTGMSGASKLSAFYAKAIGSLPYALFTVILIVIAAAQIGLFVFVMNRRKDVMTEGAIKESLDSLPDGVCFYSADGQPLLINKQMNRIGAELFGSEILNVNLFLSRLSDAVTMKGAKIIRTEPTLIVKTAEGKVWDFHSSQLKTEKNGLYELVAFDITEQYRLSEELNRKNERLKLVNERLKRLSEEMITFTAEKELLNAKISVHDNIGRSLLACRSYFQQEPRQRSRKDLIFLWQYVFSVMKNETLPYGELKMLEKTADALGTKIELSGSLPENLKIRSVIVIAIHECLTNTANHAGGDKLFVNIYEDDKTVTACLTNSGKTPQGEIKEKGGLKNLRRAAERVGAVMTIESAPRFLLRLEFKKGEENEWLKQEYWS